LAELHNPKKKPNSTGILDPVEKIDHSDGQPGGGWGTIEPNSNQDGGPENALVDLICTPAGVTLNPSRMQLSQFTSKVKESQNGEYICFLLAEQLADQDWKRRLRALHAIYELAVNKISPAHEFYATKGSASLHSLVSSSQKSIRDQAIKILTLVQPEWNQQQYQLDDTETEYGHQPQVAGQTAGAGIFVGLGENSGSVQTPGSLFGQLQISQPGAPAQKVQPKQQPVHHQPVASAEPSIDLCGIASPADAQSRPRQSSKSQLETVFNENQQKATIQSELERMQWGAPLSSHSSPQTPINFAAFSTPNYSAPTYPGGYIAPAYPVPQQQFNPTMFSTSSPTQQFGGSNPTVTATGNLGGFDFIAAKKDPFDFGDIRKLDATI